MDTSDDETFSTVTAVLSNFFLAMLIAGMAGTTDIYGFRQKLKNYRGIGTGIACQFFLLPFLGFCSVKAFGLRRLFGIMLLIVTTSPGGGFSGWWCSIGNADIALSIAMTTVSTILSIVMLPLNIFIYVQAIYGISVPLNWGGIMTSVGVVIGAVIIGLAIGTKYPQFKKVFNHMGTVGGVANITLAIIVASRPSDGESTPVLGYPPTTYIAIMAPCIAGLVISFGIAKALRCSWPESVSICIECCYQNTALAISVAVSAFGPRDAAIATLVPLFYGGVEIVIIAIFVVVAWQAGWTYAPPRINMLKCIGGNFQPDHMAEMQDQDKEDEGQGAPAAADPEITSQTRKSIDGGGEKNGAAPRVEGRV